MTSASITHLRIEYRLFEITASGTPLAPCYVFDFDVASVRNRERADVHKGVRDALKRLVPAADRGWDPDGKRWFVKVEHRETLAKLFSNFESELAGLESQGVLF
jgi:hypothetical protein